MMNNFNFNAAEILKAILENEENIKKCECGKDNNDKVCMKGGDSITYINPAFKSSFGNLADNKPNTDTDDKVKVCENLKKEYKAAVKQAQECEKEYKDMKKETSDFVFIPVTLDHSFSVCSEDYNFGGTTHLLGVFMDPNDALKAIEDDIKNDVADWKPIRDSIYPNHVEDYGYWRVSRSKYFFSRELLTLSIKHRFIIKVELNNFNVVTELSSYNMIEQDTYKVLLDVFEKFRKEYDILLSNIENSINELLEE